MQAASFYSQGSRQTVFPYDDLKQQLANSTVREGPKGLTHELRFVSGGAHASFSSDR